ncbi:hypothetical protein ACFQ0B_25630 [Nonomuraea thailandensis]
MGITLGPDDALWFVEIGAGQVGRIDTTGKITEHPLPDRAARPHAIITGPGGASGSRSGPPTASAASPWTAPSRSTRCPACRAGMGTRARANLTG